jgi:hypothetical protein
MSFGGFEVGAGRADIRWYEETRVGKDWVRIIGDDEMAFIFSSGLGEMTLFMLAHHNCWVYDVIKVAVQAILHLMIESYNT